MLIEMLVGFLDTTSVTTSSPRARPSYLLSDLVSAQKGLGSLSVSTFESVFVWKATAKPAYFRNGLSELQPCYRCRPVDSKVLILGLIICAGDVQLNPGPVHLATPPTNSSTVRCKKNRISCQTCRKLVLAKSKLRCFDCQAYFHHKCAGVKSVEAREIIANSVP